MVVVEVITDQEVEVVVVVVPDRGEVMGDQEVDLLALEVMIRIREQAAQDLLLQRWMHSTDWQLYYKE